MRVRSAIAAGGTGAALWLVAASCASPGSDAPDPGTARATASTATIRFSHGGSSPAVPVEATPAGLLFLPVRVDGTGPWPFLVDTASPSGFSRRAIDSLEVEVGLSTGPGNRTLLRDVWFQVLGAEAWQREVEVLGDDGCRIARSDCEGVAGQPFLSQFVVELDWEACVLRLHEPASWSYQGSGEALPLELEGGLPFVRAEVTPMGRAPVRGRFLVATASPDAIRLGSSLAPEGVVTKSRRLTAAGLRLGRVSLPAHEITATSGFPIPGGAAGSIGAPALRRFRVILDYFRKRMILEPKERIIPSANPAH